MNEFVTKITVRVDDVNYGGHMGNDRFLLFFQIARIEYLKKLGVSELSIGDNVSLTQTEAFIKYKNEAFMGDELEMSVSISEFSGVRFKTTYEITRPKDGAVIASGFTIMAGFDYETKKPKRIPKSFKDSVNNFQDEK